MKNLGKALKLYMKLSFNPIVSIAGLFVMGGILIAAGLSPAVTDGKDYMAMIACVSFGQIGIVALCLFGGITISRYKWFASLPFAKTLFTKVPVLISTVLSLIYGISAFTVAAVCWDPAALSDLAILLPVNSAMMCIAVTSIGKPKMQLVYVFCLVILAFQQSVLPNVGFAAHGFGLPLPIAAVIGAVIFITGILLTLYLTELWWRKCDRVYRGDMAFSVKVTQ